MSASDAKFLGWMGHDADSVGNLKWEEFEPKQFKETDVEISIECCGVCGSDLHTLRSGWGPTEYPVCVGHEIVGTATRVGSEVKHIQVGQRVGVGAQSGSCLDCDSCHDGLEPWCEKGIVGTYNGNYPDGSGRSQGGYATRARVPAHFAVPIPEGLDSVVAAPLMCGGVTVYNPLKTNGAGQPGVKRVGISGIGGLGHFGLIFAKALGAERILAISQTRSKEKLARELGATDFLAAAEGDDAYKQHARSLDLLITTNNNADMPIDKYLRLLRPGGKMVAVGLPEDPPMPTPLAQMVFTGAFVGGSLIGGPGVIKEMLELAASQNLKPLIEVRSLKDANQVVKDMEAGKPRFRYVMVNEDYKK